MINKIMTLQKINKYTLGTENVGERGSNLLGKEMWVRVNNREETEQR